MKDCNGIGARYSLSVFNFLFGLLCLSVPGFLVMLMLYFTAETCKWKKWKPFFVWLTIIFFLVCFVFTIGELLYSMLYVVQEVYGNYSAWRNSTVQCDGTVYISSFVIITVSYSVVFLALVAVGVWCAKKFFKWVTDENNPGAMRNFLAVDCRKHRRSA